MLAQYGEDCTGMKRKVYQRMERFQSGRKCITDEDCYGQQTSCLCAQPKTSFTRDIGRSQNKLTNICGMSIIVQENVCFYHKEEKLDLPVLFIFLIIYSLFERAQPYFLLDLQPPTEEQMKYYLHSPFSNQYKFSSCLFEFVIQFFLLQVKVSFSIREQSTVTRRTQETLRI